ncbi:tetratricopeptide repeat protein [Photobacterium sp. GJ3]|uniref:tetratricopeptide repeat protein n=1 Tax=Photobacterium sp. GJ3 TaxID=2829502 RepID=UPI001B8C9EB2|nr:tetratricopeptide repeat protein [Photobacterium sp. GJ3]QUJ68504.1 tetratricopeptide repeat protein [Photobacterium sp. GJ3]
MDPSNVLLALDLIEGLAKQGDVQAALHIVNQSLALNPDHADLISWKGHLCLALQQYDAAVQAYHALFRHGYTQPGLKINCALACFQQGQYEAAHDLLEQVPELDVANTLLKARCLAHMENVSQAIAETYGLLTACTPEQHAEVHGLLSLLYLDDAQYEVAEKHCRASLQLDHHQRDALITRASLSLYRLEIDTALKVLDPLMAQYPEMGRLMAMKALALMYVHQYDAAIQWYEKACQKMPGHVGSRVNLGWCYFSVMNYDGAESCFKAGLKIDRNFAECHGGLAIVNAIREKWSDSQEQFKRALKLDANCASALFARALYFQVKGKAKEAESIMTGLMAFKSELSADNLSDVVMKTLMSRRH